MTAPNDRPAVRHAIVSVLALLPLVGCVETSVTRSGERFAPFSKNCAIDFQYGSVAKAMQLMSSGYVQVASMSVARGGDSLDESMKDRVRPEACKVGAHVAMLVSSNGGDPSYVSLMLLRKQ